MIIKSLPLAENAFTDDEIQLFLNQQLNKGLLFCGQINGVLYFAELEKTLYSLNCAEKPAQVFIIKGINTDE